MSYILTDQEKSVIIEQHMKTLAYAEYNNMLSLIELKATDNPDQAAVDSLNNQISKTTAQKIALQKELKSLNIKIEETK